MSEVLRLLRAAGVECYTRAEWGSPCERNGDYDRRRRSHAINGSVPYHFLHISVTDDTDTPLQGSEGARLIETFGYSTPPMVSYQLLTTNEGKVYEGQSYGVAGTHTVNDKKVPGFPSSSLNFSGYAVALMQNVNDEVSDRQVEVVAMAFAAAEIAGYVRKGAPIYPHRKFAAKSCPGDRAVARLAEIQRLKDHYVQHGLPNQEDDVSAEDVWKAELPEFDESTKHDTRRAATLLAQTHNRAGDARTLAREAVDAAERVERAVSALAAAMGPEAASAVREALRRNKK